MFSIVCVTEFLSSVKVSSDHHRVQIISCCFVCVIPSQYSVSPPLLPVQTVRERVVATGQLLRALYKRLEERMRRTQKYELGRRTQGLDPEMILPSTPSRKGVRDPPRGLRQQEENIPGHVQ